MSVFFSLLISLVFAAAAYFMPQSVGVFWSLVICFLTFLVSYVFIELTGHVKRIKQFDVNNEYKLFKKCGIAEYHNIFSEIDFASCIKNATHIQLVLLYSNKFISRYTDQLREFISKDGTSIEFIILSNNPTSSSFQCIAEKFNYSSDELAKKLDDFAKFVRTEIIPYKSQHSSIRLFSSELIPMYTLYRFDNYAYITLYKTARERTNIIPCFKVENVNDSSFFSFAMKDVDDIKNNEKTQEYNLNL